MSKKNKIFLYLSASLFAIYSLSCSEDDLKGDLPEDGCYVQLFDGKNFKDDNIVIKGPGEFADLKNLPGASKDWDDEADSFRSGKNTIVIFWTQTKFQGDSVIYKDGAKKSKIDEPRSMKIICNAE